MEVIEGHKKDPITTQVVEATWALHAMSIFTSGGAYCLFPEIVEAKAVCVLGRLETGMEQAEREKAERRGWRFVGRSRGEEQHRGFGDGSTREVFVSEETHNGVTGMKFKVGEGGLSPPRWVRPGRQDEQRI